MIKLINLSELYQIFTYNSVGGYMDKMTSFKEFVKNNPGLIKFVRNDEMTWQKFYEMYDIYGEGHEVWNDYIGKEEAAEVDKAATITSFADVLGWLKNLDLDSLQEGISSVSRVIGVLQDFGDSDKTTSRNEYKPRPLYKHFED